MKHLVFLLEEPSAQDLLQGLLPRILPADLSVYYLVFEGKQDLERKLVRRLRGWRLPDSAFVVLRDQDAAECTAVKSHLVALAKESGRNPVLVRVACRELESWVLGDFDAIAEAFEKPSLKGYGNREAFRSPDRVVRPIAELRKLLPDYQKRDGARRMGVLLHPENNQSHSFRIFCEGITTLAGLEIG